MEFPIPPALAPLSLRRPTTMQAAFTANSAHPVVPEFARQSQGNADAAETRRFVSHATAAAKEGAP